MKTLGPCPAHRRSWSPIKALLDGKVDYTLIDDLVVQYIVNNYPEEARARLQIGTTPLITR